MTEVTTTVGAQKVPFPGRQPFWIAPPVRRAIDRQGGLKEASAVALPHLQTIVVAARPSIVEPTAFLQPIAALEGTSSEMSNLPSFFSVGVYIWKDTTLREILETVVAQSPAARRVLLRHVDQPFGEKEVAGAVHASEESPEAEGATPPVDKRQRVEAQGPTGEAHPVVHGGSSAPGPPLQVGVLRVHPSSGNRPIIVSLTKLRVERPVFSSGDYVTLRELCESKWSFKLGDLLVLVAPADSDGGVR